MVRKYSILLASISMVALAQTSGQPAGAAKLVTPLSADFDNVISTRTLSGVVYHNSTGKFYRSSDGRTRRDTGQSSLISNGGGSLIALNHATKEATVATPPPRTTTPQPTMALKEIPQPTSVALGLNTFEGYPASGVRISTTLHATRESGVSTTEIWTIRELALPVLTKTTSPQGENSQQYRNIVVGEPDPALFAIPPGYTVSNVVGAIGSALPQAPKQ